MERLLIDGTSEVLIGHGLLEEAEVLTDRAERTIAAVLTQPDADRLARDLARRLPVPAPVRVLPRGDEAKSLAVAEDVYLWLADEGLNRHDTIVAVGGGSATDLAGFVGATYLRGVEVIYVATTLLAAVDGAIGGKTAINLGAKNMVGVFRHPARIIVDLDVLGRLPDDLIAEGMVEAFKAGLVGNLDLATLIARDGRDAPLDQVVHRAVTVKADIVGRDFGEQGERAVLNYGHTVGHAIEAVTGASHGEAVAVGVIGAGVASRLLLGFADEAFLLSAIAGLGLPTSAAAARGHVKSALQADKKRVAEGLRMVLLEALGRPRVMVVDDATVDAVLDEVIDE